MTVEGPILVEDLKTKSKIPLTTMLKLLNKLETEGLLNLRDDMVEVDSSSRLKLAVKAAMFGADIEQVSKLLCWQEFEQIAAFALKINGYAVKNNVRFKHASRRWEIDVVGIKKPLVVCVDCKHWQRTISRSVLQRMALSQMNRTKAFAEFLPNPALKISFSQWDKAKFVPVLLSLFPGVAKFHYDVPLVPVLQLQDFINQLPMQIDAVKFFSKTFTDLTDRFEG